LGGLTGAEFKPGLIQSAKEPARVAEKDLSDMVLEQFKAEKFTIGKVPEVLPPLGLC
jgi:nucleoporin NUP42